MLKENELKNLKKVPVVEAEYAVGLIRILAKTGRKPFHQYLYGPLEFAGWKRLYSNENVRKMMERIERACDDPGAIHTIGPLCKRMISQALEEGMSSIGNAAIFFLEKVAAYTKISVSEEAIRFFKIIYPGLAEFDEIHRNHSEEIFIQSLEAMSGDDFREAFAPVHLGNAEARIRLEQKALILFEKIKAAQNRDDIARCRKLIAGYLISYGDEQENNRAEVDKLVEAFEKREEGFRRNLSESIAVQLYYLIIAGITEGNLKKAIRGIRKYVHIFQGDPDIPWYLEIDKLESKLYSIIREKGLMEDLKRG